MPTKSEWYSSFKVSVSMTDGENIQMFSRVQARVQM